MNVKIAKRCTAYNLSIRLFHIQFFFIYTVSFLFVFLSLYISTNIFKIHTKHAFFIFFIFNVYTVISVAYVFTYLNKLYLVFTISLIYVNQ